MAGGNLEGWGIKDVTPNTVPEKKAVNISVLIETGKKYGNGIIAAISALVVVLGAAYHFYQDNVNKEVIPIVQEIKRDVDDIKEETVQDKAVNLTNNVITDSKKTLRAEGGIASRFNKDNVRAELVIPEKPVDVYKLVKIRSTEDAKSFDLFVMTIYNNKILFIDVVPTANKGEWVFTGPPGEYSIRLAAYNPDSGVTVTVGNVVIGEVVPPTPPVVKVTIPNFVNRNYEDAKLLADALGLVLKTTNPDPKGLIIQQDVLEGITLNVGSIVNVVVKSSTPVPPVTPVFTEKYGFSTLSYNVVSTKIAVEDKKYIDAIANNFEAVAAGIAAGSWRTPDEANKELGGRNRLTFNNNTVEINKWMPFFQAWSDKAKELNTAGTLPNIADEYRNVYLETMKGLRAVPK